MKLARRDRMMMYADAHESTLREWRNPFAGKFGVSPTMPIDATREDQGRHREGDLVVNHARRILSTMIHRNMGPPTWVIMSNMLNTAGIPKRLFAWRWRHFPERQCAIPRDPGPMSGTPGIPIANDVGAMGDLDFVEFWNQHVLHIAA